MRRITIEEAKQYIPCEEDYTSKGIETAAFFTLTPSDDGWEKVTYYTARKLNIYVHRV